MINRMEKLDFRSSSFQAKSLGTIVLVSGAFIATLYKGPSLLALSPSNSPHTRDHHQLPSQQLDWIIGGVLLTITFLVSAIWNIAQVSYNLETNVKILADCLGQKRFGLIQIN